MKTTENNKIIAEFMGLVYRTKKDYEGWYKDDSFTNRICDFGSLKYHSDWNWLMEVVEKCLVGEAEHKKEGNKLVSLIYEGLTELSKIKTYNACVEFINHYNTQKL
jgi:hypothetical protein